MSREATEAIEAIRRDLKVSISLNNVARNYGSPERLQVTVELLLGDEVISESESFVDVIQGPTP